jgi:hypothetical protein
MRTNADGAVHRGNRWRVDATHGLWGIFLCLSDVAGLCPQLVTPPIHQSLHTLCFVVSQDQRECTTMSQDFILNRACQWLLSTYLVVSWSTRLLKSIFIRFNARVGGGSGSPQKRIQAYLVVLVSISCACGRVYSSMGCG